MKNSSLFKILILFSILFFAISVNSYSQTFTDSNLPIVIINTDIDPATSLPLEIQDSQRVLANMKIIKHPDGARNYLTDSNTSAFLNYNGRINIEIRGSTSQLLPKKPYSLTTLQADNVSNNNVSIFGMPSENDWILNSLAYDSSLIRDYLSYNLSQKMGNYAVKTQYCEVLLNGVYVGLYLFQEKIKADSNRVNILKITTTDNTGDNLTGGYITKVDKTTGGDPIAWTTTSYLNENVNYIHDLPKPIDVTTEQDNYIHNEFSKLQAAATAHNTGLQNGFATLIDVPSFVDFMITNEVAANVDAYQYSTYFHKDRKGKLRAGPIWDFNLTFGNDLFLMGFDRSKYNTWQFSNGDNEGSKFWKDLYDTSLFKCYLAKRLNSLTQVGQPLNIVERNSFIDTTVLLINEAMDRENLKWATLTNFQTEITNIKTFLNDRINWMTTALGSTSSCINPTIPNLVISKINYNPATTTAYPLSNDQEFIEITNPTSNTINFSGIYFSKLGLSYQFPYNSTLNANSSLFLAANTTLFQTQNGFSAFGQFTRNLSNKSQKLVLSDAFGNTIDTVEYFDSAPWPTAADGNGSYLKLTDTNLDNNIASSWEASNSLLNINNELFDNEFIITPNPTSNYFYIKSKIVINKIEIFDVLGKLKQSPLQNNKEVYCNVSNLPTGCYIIKIYGENGISTKKLLKRD